MQNIYLLLKLKLVYSPSSSTSCLLKRLFLERGVNGVRDVVCVLICSYLISPVIHLLSFARLLLCQSTLNFSLLWIICNRVINTGCICLGYLSCHTSSCNLSYVSYLICIYQMWLKLTIRFNKLKSSRLD